MVSSKRTFRSIDNDISNLAMEIEKNGGGRDEYADEISILENKIEQENNTINNLNISTDSDNRSNDVIISKSDIKKENNILVVSEKDNIVYLPYSENDVLAYLNKYPKQYSSFDDVVSKEFILNSDIYLKHPVFARFRETYSLIRDKEARSVLEAFKYAVEMMFHYDLNPAIIAACKSQDQLEHYLNCLSENKLDDFKDFEIKFEISPLKA